jgi:hypothetical protein
MDARTRDNVRFPCGFRNGNAGTVGNDGPSDGRSHHSDPCSLSCVMAVAMLDVSDRIAPPAGAHLVESVPAGTVCLLSIHRGTDNYWSPDYPGCEAAVVGSPGADGVSPLSFLEHHSGFDLVQTDVRFPVVEAAALTPVPGRPFRQSRRRVDEIPELVGGSVLVFQTNDRFALAPTGPKMLMSDVVVKATMVAVVLTRAQLVPAVAMLPSIVPQYRLALRASYNCQVLDPVRVLESGCWDVRTALLEHMMSDAKLRMMGAREDAARNPMVAQQILARVFARNEVEPPVIPGMRVRLVDMALGIHNDNPAIPGQRDPVEDTTEFQHRTRDLFADDGNGGRPRDGYATYEPDEG